MVQIISSEWLGQREQLPNEKIVEAVHFALRMLASSQNLNQKLSACIHHGFPLALKRLLVLKGRNHPDAAAAIIRIVDSQNVKDNNPTLLMVVR
jgi:hypothetical protein